MILTDKIIGLIIQNLIFIQRKVGLIERNLLYLEGGLGSQLLTYMKFLYLKEIGLQPKIDLTYFTSKSLRLRNPDLRIWPYQLLSFGIGLEIFKKSAYSKKIRIYKVKDNLNFFNENPNFLKFITSNFNSRFPTPSDNAIYFLRNRLEINRDIPFSVMHIRQGDYLKVASYNIPLEHYLNLCKTLAPLMPKKLIVCSDSSLDAIFLNKLKVICDSFSIEVHVLDEESLSSILIHDLMRLADLLIAANSTFSLTAALMSKENSVAFLPVYFYKEFNNSASPFLSFGDFFLFNRFD
jgi:hypothetical protein